MWTALLSFLLGNKKTVITIILTILAIAIIYPSFERVASFFGYETRAELKEKVEQAKKDIDTAVDANKAQEVTIKTLEATAINIDRTLSKLDDIKTLRLKKFNRIQVNRIDKIKQIELTEESEEVKQEAISKIQIQAIWDVYCEFNSDSSCASNISNGVETNEKPTVHSDE